MSMLNRSDPFSPRMEECLRLHKCWPWFMVLGIVLMIVGAIAIGSAVLASFLTVLILGYMMIGGAIVQVVNAFLVRNWRGFLLHLLAGVLQLVVGVIMIEHPGRVLEMLTLILAVAFIASGVLRLVFALVEDIPGRGWVLLNGLITFILGIMIWREWPEASLVIIGTFVGIDLIFAGWSWVMLGMFVKSTGAAKA